MVAEGGPSYGPEIPPPHPAFPLTRKLVGHSPNYALTTSGKEESEGASMTRFCKTVNPKNKHSGVSVSLTDR